jgi:hypothetical protein
VDLPPFDAVWQALLGQIEATGSPTLRKVLASPAHHAAVRASLESRYNAFLQRNVAPASPTGHVAPVESEVSVEPQRHVVVGHVPASEFNERMTLADARAWVLQSASDLAALPPPFDLMGRPLKDEQGLSASNNGPIRTFLGNGPDQSDAAYLGAAHYLQQHSGVQLDRETYNAARRALEDAAPIDADTARRLLTGGARSGIDGGSNENGTWTRKPKGAEFEFRRTVKYDNIGKRLLDPAGLVSGRDYAWRRVPNGRGGEDWFITVYAHAMPVFLRILEANGREAMAASLRAAGFDDAPVPMPDAVPVPVAAPTIRFEKVNADYWRVLFASKAQSDVARAAANPRPVFAHGPKGTEYWWQVHQSQTGKLADALRSRWPADAALIEQTAGSVAAPAAPALPTAFAIEPQGSNHILALPSRGLRTALGFLQESKTRAGWFVLTRPDRQNAIVALDAAEFVQEAAVLRELFGATVDLHELADAVSLDDVSPATAAQIRAILPTDWPPGLSIRKYQEVAVGFLVLRKRGIIGDDMGVGKTISALAAARVHNRPWVVVCPASAVYNWRNEIRKWIPGARVKLLTSKKIEIDPLGLVADHRDVLVLSWAAVEKREKEIREKFKPGYVVFDESHYAKNHESQRATGAASLAAAAPFVALLTGTPAENSGIEVFNQLRMVDPEAWPSYYAFRNRYFQTDDYGKVVGVQAHMVAELREKLRRYIVRRLKGQVLDLPPKTRSYLWFPMDAQQSRAYRSVMDNFKIMSVHAWKLRICRFAASMMNRKAWTLEQATDWLDEQVKPDLEASEKLVLIGYLRRAVGQIKAPTLSAWISDYVESSEKPLVVFVEHGPVVKALTEELQKAGITWDKVDGGTAMAKRAAIVDRFQAGGIQVLVATRALREAVTLTAASDMLFGERWWVPTTEEQAEDRIYRIGTKDAVTIHYGMLENTIDTYMHELVERKRADLGQTIGGNVFDETAERKAGATSASSVYDQIARDIGLAQSMASAHVTAEEWAAFLAGDDSFGVVLDDNAVDAAGDGT